MALRQFWQQVDPNTGTLRTTSPTPTGTPASWATCTQDLSRPRASATPLQTPEFVEEFILDRTLTPAIREFGFREVRMIDPTCGSGHFLLGGFRRLLVDEWVDTNRRATRATSRSGRWTPSPAWTSIRSRSQSRASGCWWRRSGQQCPSTGPSARLQAERRHRRQPAARQALRHDSDRRNVRGRRALRGHRPGPRLRQRGSGRGATASWTLQYHAVVGNPPYIVVRTSAEHAAYRHSAMPTCWAHRTGAFFRALPSLATVRRAGFVELITANSFMKREFGKQRS